MENPKNCFACGEENPNGLHLEFDFKDDQAFCKFELSEIFQGYPGIAHGGIVTTVLDEAMAQLLMHKDMYAVTGRLEVKFQKPVPVNKLLRAEGSFSSGKESRWGMNLEARILDEEDNILAKAKALFIDQTKEILG